MENKKEVEVTFSDLVDNDIDFLKSYIKGKDVGYLMSLKNLFASTYSEVTNAKNDTIAKRKMFEEQGDTESANGCEVLIQRLYQKLFRIEERYFFMKKHLTELQELTSDIQ